MRRYQLVKMQGGHTLRAKSHTFSSSQFIAGEKVEEYIRMQSSAFSTAMLNRGVMR